MTSPTLRVSIDPCRKPRLQQCGSEPHFFEPIEHRDSSFSHCVATSQQTKLDKRNISTDHPTLFSNPPRHRALTQSLFPSPTMEEESNASIHTKEVTRLWRAWRTIHEMVQDRVRIRRTASPE